MLSYHPTAKTTVNIRREIKENIDNLTLDAQAKKYNVCIKTIEKWRKRDNFEDAKHGAINPAKSISDIEEYIICEIRKTTLLPLDDLLDVVRNFGIKISRSALNRALKRNNLSNLRDYLKSLNNDNEETKQTSFKEYAIGYVHIDIKYLPKINGERTYLYVAIDRCSRVVFVDIYNDKTAVSANSFLKSVIDYFPFEITKILADNGKEFTDKFNNKSKKPTGKHIFDKTCSDSDIEHRLTKPYTPKTNGMVERVNGKVTVNVLDKIKFDSLEHMKKAIFNYFYSYNYHIKHSGIDRLTPIEYLENEFRENEDKFKYNFEEFNLKNKAILDSYTMGLDNLLKLD